MQLSKKIETLQSRDCCTLEGKAVTGLTRKNPGGASDGPFVADLGFLARFLLLLLLKPRDLRVDHPLDVLGLSGCLEGLAPIVRDNQDRAIPA